MLLGVEDDGTVSGLTKPATERWVMDTVFGRYILPQVLPFYEEIALDDGKRIGIVTVEQGTTKPYVLRHNDREDIYIRVGTLSRLASREQQARLFASSAMLHAETLPVSGTSLADLSTERLTNYLVEYMRDLTAPDSTAAWEARLSGLSLLVPTPQGSRACSIAGLLLFGRNPRRALPQAGIRWMAFAGNDKQYQALDDATLDGPLVPLTRTLEGGGSETLEFDLVSRLIERMTPFVSTEGATLGPDLRRTRDWHYPIEAVREGLLNAIIHRDWTRSVEVEVVAYADRLEITSPGALHNAMTVEKMLAGQRSARNPILVDVMRDYGYVDARGMGVRLKIVPLTQQFTGKDARFEAEDDYVRVILPKPTGALAPAPSMRVGNGQ